MGSYVEYAPIPPLARVVRTAWIHRTDDRAYVQRHLPTGGVEIQVPMGGTPRLLGPLTGPQLEIIPARTSVIGLRFWPGAALALTAALNELVDQQVGLADVLGRPIDRFVESVAVAPSAQRALITVQRHVLAALHTNPPHDPIAAKAVQLLMPWPAIDVSAAAARLGLSSSQLRRRFLRSVGVGPKVLQRTLRFQGFLALAQAGASASGRYRADGIAGLAVDVGYADQAHLSRECVRITGVTPSILLGSDLGRCACAHDHVASYRPFLRTRVRAAASVSGR